MADKKGSKKDELVITSVKVIKKPSEKGERKERYYSRSTVSVSDFSRGQASRIFRELQEGEMEQFTVLKNNNTVAHVLSKEKYEELLQDSQIVEFLYDLAKIEGRVYSARQLIEKIDEWRSEFYAMQDFIRFSYDDLDEDERQMVDEVIASEEYAEPIKSAGNQLADEEVKKAIESNMETIREAVEQRFKKFMDEELSTIIAEETKRIIEKETE